MASKLIQDHVCDICLVKSQRDTTRKVVADFGRGLTIAGLGRARFLCRACWERSGVRCDAWHLMVST